MAECTPSPSVTLYGTTQLVLTLTSLSTFLHRGQPTSSAVETTRVVTSVVPQQTLYAPCTQGGGDSQRTSSEPSSTATSSTGMGRSSETASVGTGTLTDNLATATTTTGGAVDPPSSAAVITTSGGSLTPTSSVTHSPGRSGSSVASTTSSTATTTAKPAANAASGTHSGSRTKTGIVLGAVFGSIVLLALLIFLRRYCQARREGRRVARDSAGGGGSGIWEKRFREIERGEHVDSEPKKLRFTLDLLSKSRASRRFSSSTLGKLSSSLFTPSSSSSSAARRLSSSWRGTSEGGEDPPPGGGLNFSRPLQRRYILTSWGSPRPDAGEISPAYISPADHDSAAGVGEEMRGRDGMEWVRTTIFERSPTEVFPVDGRPWDPVDVLSSRATRSPASTPSGWRALPPPPRAQAAPTPLPRNSGKTQTLHPPVPATTTPSDGPHAPCTPLLDKPKTARPPTLRLEREALTPSLWIDEATYARFRQGQIDDDGGSGLGINVTSRFSSATTIDEVYAGLAGEGGEQDEESPEGFEESRSAVTPQLPAFPGLGLGTQGDARL